MLINSGIETFIYRHPYNDDLAGEMIREAGIELIIME
jgi:deoxycytidylate deaminase